MKTIRHALVLAGAAFSAHAAQAQSLCGGTPLKLKTPTLSAVPYVELGLDGKTGPWLIDYGNTGSAVSSGFWSEPSRGKPVELAGFTFPTAPAGKRPFPVHAMSERPIGIGAPHGVVGTDILRTATVEFHFDDANQPMAFISRPGCDPQKVWDKGFFRIRQKGFFGSSGSGSTLSNVPVVYIQLEERTLDAKKPEPAAPKKAGLVWAQIDTGYDDSFWPYTIDINEAYLAELKKLNPAPVLIGIARIGGCNNETSNREVYTMPGWKLRIADETGITMRSRWFDGFYFIVKPKQTSCGGIGPMAVPAAQLGASFLRAFGTTIVMPDSGDVFLKVAKP
jgi:hypothetical protein